MRVFAAFVFAAAGLAVAARVGAPGASLAAAAQAAKAGIPFEDARASIEAHRAELPAVLRPLDLSALRTAWPTWVSTRNTEIRKRLAQGDEDSIVNFWLYGTSFTRQPRATEREAARLSNAGAAQELLLARLDDLVSALARPGSNERLQFARDLMAQQGIDPLTAAGREKAAAYFVAIRERVLAENARYARASQSPSGYATLFSDRGLSTDTRLTASYAIDRALAELGASGRLAPGSIARVAIVGPGLDFTDKAEGYDFYPPQTIQPFALADSLARLKLSARADVSMTTLDLSPRVNRHLDAARRRAATGAAYVMQLPLSRDQPKHEWQPDLVTYWQAAGSVIGRSVPAAPIPAIAGDVRARAVAVRSSVVTAITPEDVNIVVERLDPLPDDRRFDLIVATNILVYYDAFEQSLALANIARMLKPGGIFLTNYAVAPLPPMEFAASQTTTVYFDRQQNGDTIYAYRRR